MLKWNKMENIWTIASSTQPKQAVCCPPVFLDIVSCDMNQQFWHTANLKVQKKKHYLIACLQFFYPEWRVGTVSQYSHLEQTVQKGATDDSLAPLCSASRRQPDWRTDPGQWLASAEDEDEILNTQAVVSVQSRAEGLSEGITRCLMAGNS